MSDFSNLASFQSISDLLKLRRGRKESAADRIQSTGNLISDQFFKQQEAEKQRGFTADESQKDRMARMAEQKAADRAAGERLGISEAGATTRSQATIDAQLQIADADRISRETLAGEANTEALKRVQEESKLRIAEAEASDQRYRTLYADGQRNYFDPITGQTYRWNTNQEFDAVMQTMAENQMRARLELEASLRKDGANLGDWLNAWTTLRDEVMADYAEIWDGTFWTGTPDEALQARLIEQFNGLVDGLVQSKAASPEQAEWLKERFNSYVSTAQASEAPEDTVTGVRRFTVGELRDRPSLIERAQERAPTMEEFIETPVSDLRSQASAFLSTSIARGLIDPEATEQTSIRRVVPEEQTALDQLTSLIGREGVDQGTVQEYQRRINEPGRLAETDFEMWDVIQEFLRAFREEPDEQMGR